MTYKYYVLIFLILFGHYPLYGNKHYEHSRMKESHMSLQQHEGEIKTKRPFKVNCLLNSNILAVH